MTIVNCMPHPLTLRLVDGTDVIIPPSGKVARCSPPVATLDESMGLVVPVYRQGSLGPVIGLPEVKEGTVYVVSSLVMGHNDVASRKDVVSPGTGPTDGAIRNEAGQVIAVTRLIGRA